MKYFFFFFSILLLNNTSLIGQQFANVEIDTNTLDLDTVYMDVDIKAGVADDIIQYLQENLSYPKEAFSKNIQGVVRLQFIVEIDGSVSNFSILNKPLGFGLEEHAIDLMRKYGKFKAASIKGQKVRSYFKQKFQFKI